MPSQSQILWESFLDEALIHTSLWSSERMCYGALYCGYEWFLAECVLIESGKPDFRIYKAKEFGKELGRAFGTTVANSCWSDQKVNIARLTRHALVHNGGRITSELGKQPHDFPIENGPIEKGEIQIGASHTTDLFNVLKTKVRAVAESAVKMPKFHA